jgi:PAS domain S-box-containing protein
MFSESAGNNVSQESYNLLEQEVFELENYINDMWEFIPIPIAYVNPLGVIMDADIALANLLKMSKDDLIGTSLSDYFFEKSEAKKLEKATFENGIVKDLEALVKNSQGTEIIANISTKARKDSEGNIIGYFLSMIDTSQIAKIQSQLEEKLSELKEFHDLAVGRELRMIDLEKEVNELLTELGKPAKYSQ